MSDSVGICLERDYRVSHSVHPSTNSDSDQHATNACLIDSI